MRYCEAGERKSFKTLILSVVPLMEDRAAEIIFGHPLRTVSYTHLPAVLVQLHCSGNANINRSFSHYAEPPYPYK